MRDDEELLFKRFLELGKKSESCHYYVFSDFLGLRERSLLEAARAKMPTVHCKLFGGAEGCERVMARLGDPEELGYEEDFPISAICISARSPKYAEALTHRDYLGSILALGIERDTLGDIIVRQTCAYLFCKSSLADFICDGLVRVRHTDVVCKICTEEDLPEGELFRTRRVKIQANGERIDAIVAKVFSISREDASALFSKDLVFIDGVICQSPSKIPKVGATVSVRCHGRFIYHGYDSLTKKGKKNIDIELYV